jgi:hypothetical protein
MAGPLGVKSDPSAPITTPSTLRRVAHQHGQARVQQVQRVKRRYEAQDCHGRQQGEYAAEQGRGARIDRQLERLDGAGRSAEGRGQRVDDERQQVHADQAEHVRHHHVGQPRQHGHAEREAEAAHADQGHADEAADGRDRREDHQVAGVQAGRRGRLCGNGGPRLPRLEQNVLRALDHMHGALSLLNGMESAHVTANR